MYRTEHKSGKRSLHGLILALSCVFSQVRLLFCSQLSLLCLLFHMASFSFSPDLGDATTRVALMAHSGQTPGFIGVARTGEAVPAVQMPSLLGAGGCCPA